MNTLVDCVRRGVSRKLNETGSILCKNPTNALIYVNTTLFTLSHCYMFQPSRGHPLGVLIRFVSRVILQGSVCAWEREVCVRGR